MLNAKNMDATLLERYRVLLVVVFDSRSPALIKYALSPKGSRAAMTYVRLRLWFTGNAGDGAIFPPNAIDQDTIAWMKRCNP